MGGIKPKIRKRGGPRHLRVSPERLRALDIASKKAAARTGPVAERPKGRSKPLTGFVKFPPLRVRPPRAKFRIHARPPVVRQGVHAQNGKTIIVLGRQGPKTFKTHRISVKAKPIGGIRKPVKS